MTSQIYKSKGEKELFDEQLNIDRMSLIGNFLKTLSTVFDFKMFLAH